MDMEITRSAGWDEATTLSYFKQTMTIMKNGQPYTEPTSPPEAVQPQRVQKFDEDGLPITSIKDLRRTLSNNNINSGGIVKNTNYEPDAIDPNSFFNSGLNTIANQLK